MAQLIWMSICKMINKLGFVDSFLKRGSAFLQGVTSGRLYQVGFVLCILAVFLVGFGGVVDGGNPAGSTATTITLQEDDGHGDDGHGDDDEHGDDGHGDFIEQELSFVVLLSIAAIVAIVVRRYVRLPYTVALVLVGLVLAFFPNFLNFEISSELILDLLVPPLIFEATLHIRWSYLRRDLASILLLAIVGVMLGTFIVAGIVSAVRPEIPFIAAVAFGALISATDPVAVIAFFRSLGVGKRLAILVEGESLFNDGVAIVVFSLAISLATGGMAEFGVVTAVTEFLRVALGGLIIGSVMGLIVAWVILRNVDDNLIETATSVALAFGAFVVAEQIHVSGILAVVAAGLFVGNMGMENTSPTTKITLENFWEFLAFVTNSLVFLIIGLEIELIQLLNNIVPIIVAIISVLIARAVVIYTLTFVSGRLMPRNSIPVSFRHVMYWGGLRGAISLALALTLTSDTFAGAVSEELKVMTFGVVLFTLLIQGTTISALIRRLGLGTRPEHVTHKQELQARLYAKQAGLRELERLNNSDILPNEIWLAMRATYNEEIRFHESQLQQLLREFPELGRDIILQARFDLIRAERTALSDANTRGLISDDVYEQLIHDTDNRRMALNVIQDKWQLTNETSQEEAE